MAEDGATADVAKCGDAGDAFSADGFAGDGVAEDEFAESGGGGEVSAMRSPSTCDVAVDDSSSLTLQNAPTVHDGRIAG
jgi:hypothetical protein